MARVEITTDKQIRPDQLKEELGGKDVFTSEGGVVQAEGCTKTQLEAAVAAHIPKPTTRDLARQSARSKLTALNFTPAEIDELLA